MPKVKVHQARDANAGISSPVFGKVEEKLAALRQRAFELFQRRGCQPGSELDDWLQAEKDLFFAPHTEVNESEESYRMTISVPGFEADEVDVIALPQELLVEAQTERRLEPMRGSMRAGAPESWILHRRFGLSMPIETDRVTARIDAGSLTIDAPKRAMQRFSVRAAAA
jgi:HSP20 family molecular chaperone IbpA